MLIAENFFPWQIDLDCSVNCMDRGALLGLFKCTHLQKLMNVMFCNHFTQVYQFSNCLRHSTIKTVQLVFLLKWQRLCIYLLIKGVLIFLSSILRAGRGYNDHGTLGMTPESGPH